MSISRRDFLLTAASAAGLGFRAQAAPAASSYSAGRRRLGYGAAVTLADLDAEPRLGAAVTKYCSAIVPVYELKWGTLRPQRDVFDFEKADRLSQFARDNQLLDARALSGMVLWAAGLDARNSDAPPRPSASSSNTSRPSSHITAAG